MYAIDPHPDDAAWDAFVDGHPQGHLLQSAAWARFRAGWGWEARRVGLRHDGELVAGAQILSRWTPLGRFQYVPRGPVCAPRDPALPALLDACRAASPGIVVRYEPAWLEDGTAHGLAGLRAAATVQPRSTVRIDVRRDDDALLAAMKPKWRYNVRLAERRGVTVREAGADAFGAFGALMAETGRRDGFHTRPTAYYEDAWRACQPGARLLLAEVAGRPVAGIMTFRCAGTTTYLYGGSSAEERSRMPNHALQWAAVRLARSDGCTWYDLWGIPDAVGRAAVAGEDPEAMDASADPLWGVWRFKRGFGGEVARTVGAWDDVRKPLAYTLAFGRAGRVARRLLGRAG